MGVNDIPSTRRWQNAGFVVARTSILIITCMCMAWTLMTLDSKVGNDCSNQHLVDLESLRDTKNSETEEDRVEEEIFENSHATTIEAKSEEDRLFDPKQTFESSLSTLSDITQQSLAPQCGEGLIYKTNLVVDDVHDSNHWNKIPKIIHQTSKSQCLTEPFNKSTSKWSDWYSEGWSYYFHDDDAIQRVFELNYQNFPLLKDIHESCLISGTAKADLWRYLVLWQYGGIYSDLDTTPNHLTPNTFSSLATKESELEAFFAIEAWHFLSQYFFAIAKKHPLMHHTILATLHKLLAVDDTVAWDASLVTGPKALHQGFIHFIDDVGIKPKAGTKGFDKGFRHKYIPSNSTIIGTANYTIGAYGTDKDSNFWVWRYDKGMTAKNKNGGYAAMGMEHFGKLKKRPSGISCQQAIKARHHMQVTTKYTRAKKVNV